MTILDLTYNETLEEYRDGYQLLEELITVPIGCVLLYISYT